MRIEALQPATLVSPGELGRSTSLGNSLPSAQTMSVAPATQTASSASAAQPTDFSEVLGKELGRVNDLLGAADKQSQLVATGQAKDLQQAITAMAEADLALQVTMRVTQKAIAAYQEISRMQL